MEENKLDITNGENAENISSVADKNSVVTEENLQAEAIGAKNEKIDNVSGGDVIEKAESAEETVKETYKEMSPARLVLRRFFRSKLSIVGIVMIVFLFAFSFLGPVIYPRWFEYDKSGQIQVFPDYNGKVDVEELEAEYVQDGETVTVKIYVTLSSGLNMLAPVSGDHILGTDKQGYDVFSRLMEGGRISLTIGFIVVILETLIGVILGGISGYFGGWVDQLIMRIVDIFNCIPTLPILLIASAVIDSWNVPADRRIYLLMAIITFFSWSGVARLVRGQILSLREQEYMTATEVMGIPTWRRIFVHLMPNVMPQLIVSMTLGLGSVILYESTLSYLGLGVQPPKAAWGTMISAAKETDILQNYMNLWLPAGIMIVIAVLGFNFVGDGLRDAMDPKARK